MNPARAGAEYLVSALRPSGRFVYRVDAEGCPMRGYNLLRHCGAVWSIVDVAPDLAPSVEPAMKWIAIRHYRKMSGGYVVERRGRIKTGANALAILAHVALYQQGLRGHELIAERLGDALLNLQRSDGDFVHAISLNGVEDTGFRSAYYTGEILFALMRLWRATGVERFLDAVIRAEAALGPQRYGVAEQSHWMLYALGELSNVNNDRLIRDHAASIVDYILDNERYWTRARSTPIACRSEGLLAVRHFFDGARRQRIDDTLARNIDAQRRWQKDDGRFIGGDDDPTSRIDFTQHNISSIHAIDKAGFNDQQHDRPAPVGVCGGRIGGRQRLVDVVEQPVAGVSERDQPSEHNA